MDDDLFDEIMNTPSAQKVDDLDLSEPVAMNIASSIKKIEDELMEFLNSPSDPLLSANPTPAPVAPSTSQPSAQPTLSTKKASAGNADEDFLSWLEESPSKPTPVAAIPTSTLPPVSPQPIKEEASTTASNLNSEFDLEGSLSPSTANSAPIPNIALPPSPPSPVIPPAANPSSSSPINSLSTQNDNFLNEVFSSPSPIPSSPSTQLAHLPAILAAPFPDIPILRSLLEQAGQIPASLRLPTLLCLLTGVGVSASGDVSSVDMEAHTYRSSAADQAFYPRLVKDVEDIADALFKRGVVVDKEAYMQDMKDLLILYCHRKNVDYKMEYAYILAPLLIPAVVPSAIFPPHRALASSLFMALTTSYLPLLGLSYTPWEVAVKLTHTWLRLILTYHCPALSSHLDRVVPGWEMPYGEQMSHRHTQTSKHLDLLEKELGIGGDDDLEGMEQHNSQPHPRSTYTPRGLIPTAWLTTCMGICVPPPEGSELVDWGVRVGGGGERYGGVYMIVTLLVLNTEKLLKMNKQGVEQWFEQVREGWIGQGLVNEGYKEWFRSCAYTLPANNKVVDCANPDVHWREFVRGWIRATAGVWMNTPAGVREAMGQMETWGVVVGERERQALGGVFKKMQGAGKLFSDNDGDGEESGDDKEEGTTSGNESDDEKDDNNASSANPPPFSFKSASNMFFDQLKSLGGRSRRNDEKEGADMVFIHDTKKGEGINKATCLWSLVSEVVPGLCLSIRRGEEDRWVNPLEIFQQGLKGEHEKKSKFSSLSNSHALNSSSSPLHYFAIDLRSNPAELALGGLPKAYRMYASEGSGQGEGGLLQDGGAVAKLMEVLAPLGGTVHIVLFTAGDGYYDYLIKEEREKKRGVGMAIGMGKKKRDEQEKLVESRRQESKELEKGLASLLINRNFRHVSILEGGFMEALRYLVKVGGEGLGGISLQSLVEVKDTVQLHRMLNLPVPSNIQIHNAHAPSQGVLDGVKNLTSLLSSWNAGIGLGADKTAAAQDTASTTATATKGTGGAAGVAGVGSWTLKSLDTLRKSIIPPGNSSGAANTANANPTTPSLFGLWGGASTASAASTSDTSKSSAVNTTAAHAGQVDDIIPSAHAVPDSSGINVKVSDFDRAQALALHRMGGLKKGESITVSRGDLPQSLLFPAMKIKDIKAVNDTASASASAASNLSRYLVVSRERFLVLDAQGGGVGSTAVVKSNRHLTELAKLTFKKKDPELVTLHFLCPPKEGEDVGGLKSNTYRVKKYMEFTQTLQKHMERFK